MRLIKRLAAVILCAALVIAVPACAAGTGKVADVEKQLKLIADNAELWLFREPVGFEWYAVTDLDGNGRLEIARCEASVGTGLYSWSRFYEVNEAKDGLYECTLPYAEGDSQPDLVDEGAVCYLSDGVYYYVVYDNLRNGYAEWYCVKSALSLKDGKISDRHLDSLSYYNDYDLEKEEDHVTYTYSDAEGNAVTAGSEEELSALFKETDKYFPNAEKYEATFGWVNAGDGELPDYDGLTALLRESYAVFGLVRENEK